MAPFPSVFQEYTPKFHSQITAVATLCPIVAMSSLNQSFSGLLAHNPQTCHPRPLMPTLTPPPASGWHGLRPAPQPPWTRWDHSSCWPRQSPRRLCRERVAEPEDCPAVAPLLGDPDYLRPREGSYLYNRNVLSPQSPLLHTLTQQGLQAPTGIPRRLQLYSSAGFRAGLESWDHPPLYLCDYSV